MSGAGPRAGIPVESGFRFFCLALKQQQAKVEARSEVRRDDAPAVGRQLLIAEDRGALGRCDADVFEIADRQRGEPASVGRDPRAFADCVKNSFTYANDPEEFEIDVVMGRTRRIRAHILLSNFSIVVEAQPLRRLNLRYMNRKVRFKSMFMPLKDR